MKKVQRVRREMQTYTPDEIRQVLKTADNDRNGHLWYLALTGLRRGEIAGLRRVVGYRLRCWDADHRQQPSAGREQGA